jgi:hypothetical protein
LTFDDQVPGWQNRRGGAESLQGKPGEGFEQDRSRKRDQEYTKPAYGLQAEKGRLKLPT